MSKYRKITNTSEQSKISPDTYFADLLKRTPAGIERQEAEGQQEFLASDQIPVSPQGNSFSREEGDALLTKMGFQLGPETPGDPLFRQAILPLGWKRAGTDHSMHSDILDDKGRARIYVFYKAAFYDRKAFYWINKRYTTGIKLVGGDSINPPHSYYACVNDAGVEIYKTKIVPYDKWDQTRECDSEAEQWLKDHFPNHKDCMAYWD